MLSAEIHEFNKTLSNIYIGDHFNESYSYGQKWDTVPFPNVKKVGIRTDEVFTNGRNKIQKTCTVMETIPLKCVLPPEFEDVQEGKIYATTWDIYIRDLPFNPTWTDILQNLDMLVGDSGDLHHIHPEHIRVEGETLFFDLGS